MIANGKNWGLRSGFSSSPATLVTHPKTPDLSTASDGYLGEVQSKQWAVSLSLHWLYNCSIIPLCCCPVVCTTYPDLSGRVKLLVASLMWPSSSPMEDGLFFVQKDGSRPLQAITIKHWMTSHPRISTPYPFSTLLLVHSIELGSSPNSTFRMLTI